MPIKGQRQIHKPWVKLYLRTLHNHEIAQLSDSVWRRFMECLMFAGEERNKAIEGRREVIEGLLPEVGYMAWTLHVTVAALTDDMSRLALAGLVELHESGRWFVTNFAKWQAPSTDVERQHQHRAKEKEIKERERVIDSVTVVTNLSQNVTESRAPRPIPSMYSSAHPAVKAMNAVTSYWPGEAAHDVIIEALGDAPDMDVLQSAYKLWAANGNKLTNFAGICDWYQELRRDPSWTPQARFKRNNGSPNNEAESLWQKALKAINAGYVDDERLKKAIQAIGGSSAIRGANEYNTRQLKERLANEYRVSGNTAPA